MNDLIGEHEIVVLTEDVPAEDTLFDSEPKENLHAGMKGTVVDEDLSARGALRGILAPRPGSRPGLHEEHEARRGTLAGAWTHSRIKELHRARKETQEAFAEAVA